MVDTIARSDSLRPSIAPPAPAAGVGCELSIVVPVYNEHGGIASFVQSLGASVAALGVQAETLFVDDHSTDGTYARLVDSGVAVRRHTSNRGYGASLKTGIGASRADLVCIIDADHELAPEDIAKLLPHAPDHDMVVGARVGPRARPFPLHQRVAKGAICRLLQYWFAREVLDVNSGLRIFRRSVARDYLPILPDGFSFTSSLTLAMLLDGRPIKYTPVSYSPRTGSTKVRVVSYTARFVASYIRILRQHRRQGRLGVCAGSRAS